MAAQGQRIPKDHYVPQMYLDAFALEGPGQDRPHIFQYMKDKVVSPRISDVASEKHFYTVKEKETGAGYRGIDDIYTQIEGLAAEPLKKIIGQEDVNIEPQEAANLAAFFALLATRTPGFINGMKSMSEEALKEHMAIDAMNADRLRESMKKAGMEMSEKELKEYQEFVIEKRYNVDFGNKGYFLGQGIKIAQELAQWFYERKHWHLLVSDSERVFLTSDNPVSIFRPVNVPPAMSAGYRNGTLLIPISPKLALLLRDLPHDKQKIKLSRDRVDRLNQNTMDFSTNYVFSNLKSKQIHSRYARTETGRYEKTTVKRHKWAPYIFMGPPPVPEEPRFGGGSK
jgi:hypothetical protein